MTIPTESDLPQIVADVIGAVQAAADPERLLKKALRLEDGMLVVGAQQLALHERGRLFLVAIGKAAPALASAAVDLLGETLTAGVAVIPAGSSVDLPRRVQVVEGSHPLPNEGSLRAGQVTTQMLEDCQPEDRVLVLISGGGSAMFEILPPQVDLDEIRRLNEALLHSGAPIGDINEVRKALSKVKGGGLARTAAPAPVLALIMSDVVGDSLAAVASGPTVLEPPNPAAARAVLEEHDLWTDLAPPLQAALLQRASESPPIYRPINILLGSNRDALDAARERLDELGFETEVLTSVMEGEARVVGQDIAASLLEIGSNGALLAGGETTVTVHGSGSGGRNTELALSAALALEGREGRALLALATDGLDGGTDAAGAVVTSSTAQAIRAAGMDPEARLANNDSYPALEAAGALIRTGPTGTNLNDLVVGLSFVEASKPPAEGGEADR